jgi:acyl dehydratase
VYPGDTLSADITVTAYNERDADWGLLTITAQARNQRGEIVLVNVNKLLIQRKASTLGRPGPLDPAAAAGE